MASMLALLVFPLLMAFAASSDLLTMRISNGLVLIIMAGFFVLAFMAGLPIGEIGWHGVVAATALAAAFAFFAFGWIGGGDAKLVAATALWIGPAVIFAYLIYAALLGGALTLLILGLRRHPLPDALAKVVWLDRLHDSKSGVPYGIALAIAGLLVYSDTPIFQHFIA